MKAELKNIKFSESLSEETNAFTAKVYVNGQYVADAINRGHGGSTQVSPRNMVVGTGQYVRCPNFAFWEQYLTTLPPIHHVTIWVPPDGKQPGPSGFWEYDEQPSAEQQVDDLLEVWLREVHYPKKEKARCKSMVRFRLKSEPGYERSMAKGTVWNTATRQWIMNKYGPVLDVILNDLHYPLG